MRSCRYVNSKEHFKRYLKFVVQHFSSQTKYFERYLKYIKIYN